MRRLAGVELTVKHHAWFNLIMRDEYNELLSASSG
jgi:hypothetical protein